MWVHPARSPTGRRALSISGILYAIATVVFLLAAFGATLGDDINLVPLGLALVAAGLTVSAFGIGARVHHHHD